MLKFLPSTATRVLEIGCGDSLLGEAIYDHLIAAQDAASATAAAAAGDGEKNNTKKKKKKKKAISVVCTDISPVAIERLIARQQSNPSDPDPDAASEDQSNNTPCRQQRQRPGLRYLVADATSLPATFAGAAAPIFGEEDSAAAEGGGGLR